MIHVQCVHDLQLQTQMFCGPELNNTELRITQQQQKERKRQKLTQNAIKQTNITKKD